MLPAGQLQRLLPAFNFLQNLLPAFAFWPSQQPGQWPPRQRLRSFRSWALSFVSWPCQQRARELLDTTHSLHMALTVLALLQGPSSNPSLPQPRPYTLEPRRSSPHQDGVQGNYCMLMVGAAGATAVMACSLR